MRAGVATSFGDAHPYWFYWLSWGGYIGIAGVVRKIKRCIKSIFCPIVCGYLVNRNIANAMLLSIKLLLIHPSGVYYWFS